MRDELIRDIEEGCEQLIAAAREAVQGGLQASGERWGPREVVAHLAGWESIQAVQVRHVAGGMPPLFAYAEGRQWEALNEAINGTSVALAGEQSFDALCDALRAACRRDVEMLRALDDPAFQPDGFVVLRTRAGASHLREHAEQLRDELTRRD